MKIEERKRGKEREQKENKKFFSQLNLYLYKITKKDRYHHMPFFALNIFRL